MDSESKTTDLRDASFAYLTAAQQNYVFKITESAQSSHPDVTSSLVPSTLNFQLDRPTKVGEGEISIFGAEQYFNMKLDDENRGIIDVNARNFANPTDHKRSDLNTIRSRGRLGTPSVSSESSLNSQTALLQTTRRKKANERWFFPGFSCNGSCSDDKSININENVAQRGHQVNRRPPKFKGRKLPQSRFLAKEEPHMGSKREDYLVLPTVNSGFQQKSLEIEDPRKSLEVFGKHVINKEDIASNLERKLSVLTWDAIPFSKAKTLPTNSEDIPEIEESDASSDLFEIENISCSTQPIYSKKISDEMSGCMSPASETSVEWTADFSFVSDIDEKKKVPSKGFGNLSSPRNRRPNGLLGCTSQKAVNVSETAYKRNEKPNPKRSLDSSTPARKLSADYSKNFHYS